MRTLFLPLIALLLMPVRWSYGQGTVPTFSHVTGETSYTLAGRDPARGGTTTIPTVLVPITLSFEANKTVVLDASRDVASILRSPVFSSFGFPSGGTTQYADAMLRTTFPKAEEWHTLLGKPEVRNVRIAVPLGYGYILTSKSKGGALAVVDVEFLQRELFKQLSTKENALMIAVTRNTTYYALGDATVCCSWGTHGIDNGTGNSFVLGSYIQDAPAVVEDRDVQPLSQQLAEFIKDPLHDPMFRGARNAKAPGNTFSSWMRPVSFPPGDQGVCGGTGAGSQYFLLEPTNRNPKNNIPGGVAGIGKYTLSNAYDLTVLCGKSQELVLTTITTAGLRLSANGRWAFGNSSRWSDYSGSNGYVVDLTTGVQTGIPPANPFARSQVTSAGRPVANDGTAVYSDRSVVVVVKDGNFTRIPIANGDQRYDAAIDAAARFVVFTVTRNTNTEGSVILGEDRALYLASAAGGAPGLLAEDGYSPSISDDGTRILYVGRVDNVPQAWILNPDGSGRRQLTADPAGISAAIISGDGRVAYALTLAGRLIRIGVDSRDVTEVVPRTPWLDSGQYTAPDRFSTFTGAGFARQDTPTASIQGKPAVVAGVESWAISILVPPDVRVTSYPEPDATLEVSAAPASPFEGPRTKVQISNYAAESIYNRNRRPGSGLLAAHQDWSALVTPASPARPGEVIHTYAVGLGPTAPTVPYGAPAPSAEPFARPLVDYTCTDWRTLIPIKVFYQGLAPALSGIYQVDIQIPEQTVTGDLFISCSIGTSSSTSFGGRVPVK